MRHLGVSWTMRWRILVVLLLLVGSLWLGRPFWLPLVGAFLIVSDPLHPADAIIPLGGNPERVPYAAQLFRAGYAPAFVAFDLGRPPLFPCYADPIEIKCIALQEGVPSENIYLTGEVVTSTYTEARAVRELAEAQGWRSIIVVTSSTHTRRARIIFRHVFRGSGIELSVQPVANDRYDPDNWWQISYQRREVEREYLKLAAFLVGYRSGR